MGPLPLLSLAAAAAFGFSKEVHTELTQEVLSDKANFDTIYDAEAREMVVNGNLLTDKDEWTSPKAHFDDEKFKAGSARLREKLELVITELDACRPDSAREQLGRVLHGVQDFFSHSNWVENHAAEDPIDLFSLENPAEELLCDREKHLGGLTSGYFPDDKRPNKLKCVHAELNKDRPDRENHAQARAKARSVSSEVLKSLESAIFARFPKRGAYRVYMLKHGSTAFKQANKCVSGNGSEEPRKLSLPKGAEKPF